MYSNTIEYKKNEKRILKHTERCYWLNGLDRRPWTDYQSSDQRQGTFYTFAFSCFSFASILCWVKYKNSINITIFKPAFYLLKD